MDHNQFQLMDDLVTPFKKFIKQIDPELADKRLNNFKKVDKTEANITKGGKKNFLQRRQEIKRDEGKIRYPENPKYNYMITTYDAVDIHLNLFDQSSVEYDRNCKRGSFEIKFD